jgi:hypothetical protein
MTFIKNIHSSSHYISIRHCLWNFNFKYLCNIIFIEDHFHHSCFQEDVLKINSHQKIITICQYIRFLASKKHFNCNLKFPILFNFLNHYKLFKSKVLEQNHKIIQNIVMKYCIRGDFSKLTF